MKTRILLSTLFLLCVTQLWAYDVVVDGIYYDLDSNAKTASAVKGDSKYTGNITIPETITVVGIDYSVTTIGVEAFFGCTGLTSITIPNSVTSIRDDAFYNCEKLTSVEIPNSVTSLGKRVFYGCNGLTSVIIPNSITDIEDMCFAYCRKLTSIDIPNSVTSIGDYAFTLCTSLTSLEIPNSVTSIGGCAFSQCENLSSVTIPNSVTSIGSAAFSECKSLTSVEIPNSVTSIENSTFIKCYSLASVIIPNSITSIGSAAFSECKSLTSVEIPNSVTSIGDYAFTWCTSFTSVTIPNSVTSIGDEAFSSCENLTSLTLSNNLTTINKGVFVDCFNLTSIVIPNSVTEIKEEAFWNCWSLTSIVIPNSVTNIEKAAFYYCALKDISIGSGVTTIDEKAFSKCLQIENVYCYAANVPSLADDTFIDSNASNATLYVPASSVNSYKAVDQLKAFKQILPIPVPVTSITLNTTSATLEVGESMTLTASFEPTDATDKSLTWISGNISVATVDSEGKVTTIAAGTTTITATANDGSGKYASCNVTVNALPIATHKLIYKVDGEPYKEYDIEDGEPITPEAEPTKTGYTFSGWSEILKNMPANDVVVTGSFTINQYTVKFVADGVTIKEDKLDYGSAITAPANPTKNGSEFKGWDPEVDKTVPSHDVTYKAVFEAVSGIDELFLNAAIVKVHSILGQLIKSNATKDDVNSLPSGIYIINGKKITLR